jgi:hypothetical protein
MKSRSLFLLYKNWHILFLLVSAEDGSNFLNRHCFQTETFYSLHSHLSFVIPLSLSLMSLSLLSLSLLSLSLLSLSLLSLSLLSLFLYKHRLST